MFEHSMARSPVAASVLLLGSSVTSVGSALLTRHIPATVPGGAKTAASLVVVALGLFPSTLLTQTSPPWQVA
jgi:hypothetical protein